MWQRLIEVYSQCSEGVWFGAAVSQEQILASSFSTSQATTLKQILSILPYDAAFQVFHEPSDFAKEIFASLKAIYYGKDVDTNFRLALTLLPAYTQKVLKATQQIPLGYATFYSSISEAVGGGPRAVGNVMASNPFAPIVPCHRVVRSDLTLGGYGGGLKTKIELLNREKRGFSSSKELRVNGGALKVFPVEYVLSNLTLT